MKVSTEDQAKHGYSLGDQVLASRNRLKTMGLSNIEEYIDDGYSAEFLDRPALNKLREDIRQGLVKSVTVYDPDRLSRNLTNQLILADEIEKSGIPLYFVTGDYDASPEGRLFFAMRGAISAYEKAKIRERTMRGKRAKASQGKMIQRTQAYGYHWDEENCIYAINESEAKIVRLIYRLYLNRHYSVRDLAILLRQQKIMNRQDKHFTVSHIHRLLTDEKYAGTMWSFKYYEKKVGQYKRQRTKRKPEDWIPITIPPIVTVEQFQQVQQILQDNYRKNPRNTKHQYLLRGLIKCAVCEYSMSSHGKIRPSGTEYTWYKCNSGGSADKALISCGNPGISANILDEMVWNHLCKLAKNKNLQTAIQFHEDNSAKILQLSKNQEETKKKQATILRWFREGILSMEDAEKELAVIIKDLQTTSSSLSELATERKKPANVSPDQILLTKTFADKRLIIENLGWTIYVDNRTNPINISFRLSDDQAMLRIPLLPAPLGANGS